jgi:hypothetical protein
MVDYVIPRNKFSTFGRKDLEHFIQLAVAPVAELKGQAKEVQKRIADFYASHNAPSSKNSSFYLQRYTQLCSDLHFNVPILLEAQYKANRDWPIYLYEYVYFNKALFDEDFPVKATYHGVDQSYLITTGSFPFKFNDDDRLVEKTLVDILQSFVKNGVPTIETIWPLVKKDGSLQYLKIGPHSTSEKLLFSDRLKFWSDLTEHYDYDVVRGIHRTKNSHHVDEL